MYTTSPEFKTKLLQSHSILSYVDILTADPNVSRRLYVVEGSVTIKNTDAVGRSCRLTLTDPDGTLTPHDAEDLLSPAGTEIKPWRGIELDSGTFEMIPQGVFGLDETEIDEDADGGVTISLTGYDRSHAVAGPLGRTMAIPAGTLIENAIKVLVQSKLLSAVFALADTRKTTSILLLAENDDPWAKAQTLAESVGFKLYFDRNGICTMKPIGETLRPTVVPQYNEGANATFMVPRRTLSVSEAANEVVVTGTANGTSQIKAVAADNNPNSRTYVGGAFGRRTVTIESSVIWTQEQADNLAGVKLNELIGNSEQIVFDAIPDPSLDEGDVVHISRPKLGVNGRQLIVDAIEVPMSADTTMKVTAQRSLLVPDEEDTLAVIVTPRLPLYRSPPAARATASATPPRISASDVRIAIPAAGATAAAPRPSIFAGRVDIAIPAAAAIASSKAPGMSATIAQSGYGLGGYGEMPYGGSDPVATGGGYGNSQYGMAGYGL
jgi:hypothetical protein